MSTGLQDLSFENLNLFSGDNWDLIQMNFGGVTDSQPHLSSSILLKSFDLLTISNALKQSRVCVKCPEDVADFWQPYICHWVLRTIVKTYCPEYFEGRGMKM